MFSGEEKVEVKLMSKVNADTEVLVDYNDALQAWLRQVVEDVMDQRVVKTDMKLRHILNKGLEVNRKRYSRTGLFYIFSFLSLNM